METLETVWQKRIILQNTKMLVFTTVKVSFSIEEWVKPTRPLMLALREQKQQPTP